MMHRFFSASAVAAGLIFTVQSGASAEDASCGCLVPAAQQSQALGAIQSFEGRVVVLGGAGPRQGAAGQLLSVGDRVATSVQSSALVVAGGCRVALAGEQELRFERRGDQVCVSVNNNAGVATTGQVQQRAAAGTPSWVAPAAAVAVIGGAAIAVVVSDSDDKVSQ